jgi:outer membrane beta-barrel protein
MSLVLLTLLLGLDPDNPPVTRVPAHDESVYVVEHREFTKRGHLEITAFVGTTVNDRWILSAAPMLSLTYHIRENIAIEAIGMYQFNRYSSAFFEVQDAGSPADAELKWMEWFAGADVQWAPLYGKLRLVPGVLSTYDVYIAVGFGVAGTRSPCDAGRSYVGGNGVDGTGFGVMGISGNCPDDQTQATLPAGMRFAGQFGAGFRMMFSRYFGIRFEFRDIAYAELVDRFNQMPGNVKQEEVSTDIRHNVMLMLGLSLLL